MPNHIHGIITIRKAVETQYFASHQKPGDEGVETQHLASPPSANNADSETQNIASLRPPRYKNRFGPQSGNLSSIIRGFKAAVTTYATVNNILFGWQPRFHDHIVRDFDDLEMIRKYIRDNPKNWHRDKENPEGLMM